MALYIDIRGEVVGTSNLQLVSQRHGWPGCEWHSKWGQSCGTKPLTCGVFATPGIVSELN